MKVRTLERVEGPACKSPKVPTVSPSVWAASLAGKPDAKADGKADGKGSGKGGPARERSRRRRMVQKGLLVVLVLALVAVSALLVIVWRQKGDLSEDARQRKSLVSSAEKVADVFFNWDYGHMKQSFDAKYPLLTKKAADSIRPTAATLTSYFTQNKVSSKATISGAYPGDIKDGAANVLVVINTKVTTNKTVQSNTGATVGLSMKRVSGKWLAGNITLLSQGAQSATDENGKPISGGGGSQIPGTIPSTKSGK